MTIARRLSACLHVCLLLAGLAAVAPARASTTPDCPPLLRIGYVTGWPPYQYVDAQGTPMGVDIASTRALFADLGCRVEYMAVGWPRALVMLEKGLVDVLAGASYAPERAAYAYYSHPYRQEVVALYVRAGEAARHPLRGLADIETQGFRLGITGESVYGPEFEALMQRPGFKAMVTPIQGRELPTLVNIGRLDGYLLDVETAAVHNQTRPPGDRLERHPAVTIDNGAIALMLSRATINPAFLDRVNAAIRRGAAMANPS